MNNVLEDIFTESYAIPFDSENQVLNVLNHFCEGRSNRLKYDCDAYYFKNYRHCTDEVALHGDTIVSFWQPYARAIKVVTGHRFSKTSKGIEELIENLGKPGYAEVNNIFSEYARVCYSGGNFMKLPHRRMQIRGLFYQDRIDKTLYECFPGGKFAGYFENSVERLEKWVREENLTTLFENEVIDKDGIIPFNQSRPYCSLRALDLSEIEEYLERSVELIEVRNSVARG